MHITSINHWKPLFELNFSENSIKTIKLFAHDFHEVVSLSNITLLAFENEQQKSYPGGLFKNEDNSQAITCEWPLLLIL